jgi:hypothetical protein
MHPRGQTPVEPKLYIVLAKYPMLPDVWWAHPDLNQGPSGYEPVALTAELWARAWQGPGDTHLGSGSRAYVYLHFIYYNCPA